MSYDAIISGGHDGLTAAGDPARASAAGATRSRFSGRRTGCAS
jgi:hypothetical protein